MGGSATFLTAKGSNCPKPYFFTTIDWLVKRGYEALTTWYQKVAPKCKSSPLFPIV